jgi:hypothetical protein
LLIWVELLAPITVYLGICLIAAAGALISVVLVRFVVVLLLLLSFA